MKEVGLILFSSTTDSRRINGISVLWMGWVRNFDGSGGDDDGVGFSVEREVLAPLLRCISVKDFLNGENGGKD
jgi:hypothetical protein